MTFSLPDPAAEADELIRSRKERRAVEDKHKPVLRPESRSGFQGDCLICGKQIEKVVKWKRDGTYQSEYWRHSASFRIR